VGYNYKAFAKNATIIVVDIDCVEHQKRTRHIDHLIVSDLSCFFSTLPYAKITALDVTLWGQYCKRIKDKFPVCTSEYRAWEHGIHMYSFMEALCQYMPKNSVIVSDAGSAVYVVSQTLRKQKNQIYVTSGAQAEMGFALPGAIGCAYGHPNSPIIAITGDGSLQMNIQELQTMKHHNLPIKLFVWNNRGYLSIKTTQDKFFDGDYIGTDRNSGVSFLSLGKISHAYELTYWQLNSYDAMDTLLPYILNYPEPTICEVICGGNQEVTPIVTPTRNSDGTLIAHDFDDMYPFISKEDICSDTL
jgi:acetolactate synthase-1/2/3 large subunit